jgi:hypothetical protein
MPADVSYLSPGPNQIYIQHFTNNAPTAVKKLGLASGGVRRRLEPLWRNAENDGQGEAPAEATFQGVAGIVSFTLTIFDEAIVEESKLFLPNITSTPGLIPPGGIGSFLQTGLNYFRLLLWRPYAQTMGQNLQPFINIPSCRLMSCEDLEDNREKRVLMVWEVRARINQCAGGNAYVYNYDGSGWPGAIACV